MSGVPENHRVEEAFGVLVRKLERPVPAAVGGTEIGAVSTAGPGDLLGDGADPSEVFGAVCFLYLGGRLGLRKDASGPEQEHSQRSRHKGIVAEKLPVALAPGGRQY